MARAHELGLKSSATMMFGHVETLDDRLEHLQRLRDQQTLPVVSRRSFAGPFSRDAIEPGNIMLPGVEPVGSSEYLRMQALSRIFLDNIPNLQSSWVTQGPKIGQVALKYGANDFGSVMMEENVVSAAAPAFAAKRSRSKC
jgi:cyclic dehypoxanthinyl futalosine synthase